jgi:hypothetical protein
MDKEAKPRQKNSKIWMKLLNLDENIAYEWMLSIFYPKYK